MRYAQASLDDPAVVSLLEYHHRDMFEVSPPGTAYAFDLKRLREPDICIFGAWDGEQLQAVGALRSHDDYAEIKSMRTLPEFGGKGLGRGLLTHLLDAAREAGFQTVRLETGISAPFTPANRLYQKFGFTEIGPFAGYQDNGDNRFYEKRL